MIQIPADIMETYGLKEGDELEVIPLLNAIMVRKRSATRHSRTDLSKFVGIARKTALTETTDEYMREVRGERR